MPLTVTAAVLRELSVPFTLETLAIDAPRDDEVLVKIAGAGICHTDVKVSRGYAGVPVPVVLGHEGAGIVTQTGKDVGGIEPGDHVVLTFNSCGHCTQCLSRHPAYCDETGPLSFSCARPGDGSPPLHKGGENIHGYFFAQSSFATHAIATARNVIKVEKDLPLERLGPLGCGFQTGAGTVLNVMQPAPGRSLAVFGTGNVGLSAVMAAKIAAMDPVIALDINGARLDMAGELGATHCIDLNKAQDPLAAISKITRGKGVNFAMDTTNAPQIVRQAFECLGSRGTFVHTGGGGRDLTFPGTHLLAGRTIKGVIQGDSDPGTFIPRLLDYYREGKFPFDRLLRFYPLAKINRAVADMESGKTIKPVLMMGEE